LRACAKGLLLLVPASCKETSMNLTRFPRVRLTHAPTPLEHLPNLSRRLGGPEIYVKRDDATGLASGGNKTRKLEFLLGGALADERRAVITFGAYGSNHALATAVHATALGIEPHVVLSPQAPGPFAARTLRAHAGLGTRLHLAGDWNGKRTAVTAKRELVARDGIDPCIIPMGGSSASGALGFVNAAFELLDQVAETGLPTPTVVYTAAGTLGTAIGLAVGFAAAGVPVRVVGVRVTPDDVASEAVSHRLAEATIALLRSLDDTFPALTFDDLRFTLRHDWFEPGYGIVTPETTEAVGAAAEDGVVLETTYTGKALAALLDDAQCGLLRGANVVFWDTYHSGALPLAGDDSLLPEELREYVAECDRLFGRSE
jgi:1-aminocyclopropane-1-carboxylate deaminase/D-cysteine desulfhydrase-like pyridoxal-dependent ACC family enzyme